MATRAGSGFWRGLATGLILAAMAGLALAWIFPPVPRTPPAVTPGSLVSPPEPERPAAIAAPEPPRAEGILPAKPPAPLIENAPAPESSPATGPGSPSLVPADEG